MGRKKEILRASQAFFLNLSVAPFVLAALLNMNQDGNYRFNKSFVARLNDDAFFLQVLSVAVSKLIRQGELVVQNSHRPLLENEKQFRCNRKNF